MNSFYSIVLAAAVAAAPPLSEYSRYESLDNTERPVIAVGLDAHSVRDLGVVEAFIQ